MPAKKESNWSFKPADFVVLFVYILLFSLLILVVLAIIIGIKLLILMW